MAAGGVPDSALFICDIGVGRNTCQVNDTGNPEVEHRYLYSIEWSRFGNVVLERWNSNAGWVTQ